jgi:hypothetical protein
MAGACLFYFTICWLTWAGLLLFIRHNIVLELADLQPIAIKVFLAGVFWPIGIPLGLILLNLSYSTRKE